MLLKAVSTTQELVERILPENCIPSLRIGLKYMNNGLLHYIQKAKEGAPIVGYHFAFPSEYLACFDCVPVCVEGTGYFLATLLLNGVEKYYDLINSYGHPLHTCSAQKTTMQFTLDNLFEFDALITPTAPCDSTCASYPFFKFEKDFPLIIADMPFLKEEKSYQYYANQIKSALIKFGETIGQEPDFEKLKSAIQLERET